MPSINVSEERKRYFLDGEKWFCETTIYRLDTQSTDRSWVREVSASEVPLEAHMEHERILPAGVPAGVALLGVAALAADALDDDDDNEPFNTEVP